MAVQIISPPSSKITHSNQNSIMVNSRFFVCAATSQGSFFAPAGNPASR